LLKKILPMFAVSALVILVHFTVAPPPQTGGYKLYWDAGIFSTLWTYWTWALGPVRLAAFGWIPSWLAIALTALLSVAALALWRRAALLGLAWFVLVLAPYLPLREHKMDYYLAVPAIGIALLGACGLAQKSRLAKAAAAACVTVYSATSAPAAWAVASWHHARAERVKDFVLGVAEIRQSEPGKLVLLDGIDTDLFRAGIADVPFLALDIPHVYLVPGAASQIQAPPELVGKFVLPEGLALRALTENRAVVYRVDGAVLRNSTRRYRETAGALWQPEMPRFVNPGDPVFAGFLGTGWNQATHGTRTTKGTATLRLGGPRSPADRFYLGVFRTGTFRLSVRANGTDLRLERLGEDFGLTEFRATPPAGETLDITIEASEPLRFGYIEVR
jgi:hypothetical protein